MMYRIFKESYSNLIESLDKKDIRYKYAKNLELLCDMNEYEKHKNKRTLEFKKIGNLVYYIQENIKSFPRLQYFTSILRALGVSTYNTEIVVDEIELEESAKMLNTIIHLNYWR